MRLLFIFLLFSGFTIAQNNENFYDYYEIDKYIELSKGESDKECKIIFKRHLNKLRLASIGNNVFKKHFKHELLNYPLAYDEFKKNYSSKLKKTLLISSFFIYPITSVAIIGSLYGTSSLLYLFSGEGLLVYFGGSFVSMIPGIIILNKKQNLIRALRVYHKEYQLKNGFKIN